VSGLRRLRKYALLTRTLEKVRTEMSLHVLAYNMKRVIAILGVGALMQAIRV
jgi:transposase